MAAQRVCPWDFVEIFRTSENNDHIPKRASYFRSKNRIELYRVFQIIRVRAKLFVLFFFLKIIPKAILMFKELNIAK